ncbi:MAG: hypothetical protein H7143_09085 [Pseudorhodobacter sp.]|nr:hypothetical protein [Rhizobacter sp.]
MQQTDDQQANSPAWVSLRLKLATSQTAEELAALCDTIERHGIFKQGDFDRRERHLPDSPATAWAVKLVRSVWNFNAAYRVNDEQHPMDACAGFPEDPYGFFGWPTESLPTFIQSRSPTEDLVAIGPSAPAMRPKQVTGERKRTISRLVIIAALLKKLLPDHKARGTAAFIRRAVEDLGLKIDEETVKGIVDEIDDALDSRGPG